MSLFSQGEYVRALQETTDAEIISKVLYPSDNHDEGKMLRLTQQYFLVSASLQNIIADHLAVYGTLYNFADKVAIHINDTHPALCIPELMRILMDIYSYMGGGVVCRYARDLVHKPYGHARGARMLERGSFCPQASAYPYDSQGDKPPPLRRSLEYVSRRLGPHIENVRDSTGAGAHGKPQRRRIP